MKRIINITGFLLLVLLTSINSSAQSYFTRNGEVSFHSKAPLEDIDASTKEATSIIEVKTGEIAFAILMKSFQFKKALMQEHFNENYVESSKYPKATFKGKFSPTSINIEKNGSYTIEVEGELTIHGVTQHVKILGTVKVMDNTLLLSSDFKVEPEDYDIEVPSLVRNKIAKIVDVKVNSLCKPFKK